MSGWWTEPRGQAGSAAASWAERLRQESASRVDEARVLLEVYGEPAAEVIAPSGGVARVGVLGADVLRAASRIGVNVLRSCTDAVASRIGAQEVEPYFLSRRGDATRQRAAVTRTRYVSGTWRAAEARGQFLRALRYAILTGFGAVKVAAHGGRIWVDALLPGELLFDSLDALHGSPSLLAETRLVPREVAEAAYGTEVAGGVESVRVVEAWHVPRGVAPKGRHVVTVDGVSVVDEEVTWHPYAWLSWKEPWCGVQSQGLGTELLGLQLQINAVLRQIAASVRAGGNLHLLTERGSRIARHQITDELGMRVLEYTGQPPAWLVPPTVEGGLLNWLQWLVQRAYEMSGVSELTAAGTMPAGLAGSGRAQLVYAQIESQRFVHAIRAWERLHARAAEITVRTAAGMDDPPAVGAMGTRGSWLDTIRISDLEVDDGPLAIEVHTQAGLPVTPSGRLAYAMQLQQLGLVTPAALRQMLRLPDTDADDELENAPADLIDAQIEGILERGEMIPPSPLQDLVEARRRGVLAHQRATLDGADEERLGLLEDWLSQIDSLMEVASDQGSMVGDVGAVDAAGGGAPNVVAAAPGGVDAGLAGGAGGVA